MPDFKIKPGAKQYSEVESLDPFADEHLLRSDPDLSNLARIMAHTRELIREQEDYIARHPESLFGKPALNLLTEFLDQLTNAHENLETMVNCDHAPFYEAKDNGENLTVCPACGKTAESMPNYKVELSEDGTARFLKPDENESA